MSESRASGVGRQDGLAYVTRIKFMCISLLARFGTLFRVPTESGQAGNSEA